MFISLLYISNNECNKDTDEQPDEEIHGVRSGQVLSTGMPVLIRIWLPIWNISEPCTMVFIEVSPSSYNQLLTQFPERGEVPSLEKWVWMCVWGWSFQTFNHGLVFWVTSPYPGVICGPTQSHLITTKDAPSALSLRKLQGFQFCAWNKGQRTISIFYYLIVRIVRLSYSPFPLLCLLSEVIETPNFNLGVFEHMAAPKKTWFTASFAGRQWSWKPV